MMYLIGLLLVGYISRRLFGSSIMREMYQVKHNRGKAISNGSSSQKAKQGNNNPQIKNTLQPGFAEDNVESERTLKHQLRKKKTPTISI
jgi:hypothetical protein